MTRTFKSFVALAVLAAVLVHSGAHAFPDAPVKLIVPFAPGGPTDSVSRIISEGLSEEWRQPVVVDNKAGANTAIGAAALSHAKPDGLTLLLGTYGMVTNPLLSNKLPYDPASIRPVAFLVEAPMILFLRKDIPGKTMADLLAWTQKSGAPLKLAMTGSGSSPHIAAVAFSEKTGIAVMSVPYRGAALAMTDLLGGQVDGVFSGESMRPYVESQKINAMFVAQPQRLKAWSTLPSAPEAGVTDFTFASWFGVFAPVGVPDALLQKINADLQKVLSRSDVQTKLQKAGFQSRPMTTDEFGQFVAAQEKELKQLVGKYQLQEK